MKKPLSQASGFIYLLMATLCTSPIPVAVKIGLRQEVSPVELVSFRMVLASLVLWAYFLCFQFYAARIDRAGLIGCFQSAIANCFSMLSYFWALYYIDASLATLVYASAHVPIVILLSMIQGEHPSRLDLFRFLLALLGLYLFIGPLGNLNWMGIGLSVATAFCFGVHITLIQWRLGAYSPLTVGLYVITFMAILLGILYLAYGYRLPRFDTVTWGALLWIAIVATAIARLLLFTGIQKAGSRQAALLSPLETLLAVLFAVWWLGEWLTPQQWLGTLCVVISVGLGAKAK